MRSLSSKSLRITHALFTLAIILLALLPLNSAQFTLNNIYILSFRLDYLAHFAIFIPWMGLAWLAWDVSFRKSFGNALLWVFIGILFASFSEGIQYFLSYRSFNINDLVGNCLASLEGLGQTC
jgi:VanZ family protein